MRLALALAILLVSCATDDRMLESNDQEEAPPVQPAQGDFADFIACIHFDDFVAANMAGAWSTLDNNCTTCHRADGMFSGDATRFFDDLKHRTYVQIQFFTFDRTTETVEVNTETIPRIGKALAPYTEHPRFNATKGLAATADLYDRTLARMAAGTCQ